MGRKSFGAILTATILLTATACTGRTESARPTPIPTPPGDLYTPPDPLPEGRPGDLIWAKREPPLPGVDGTIWKLLYHSRSRDDRDIAVSAFAILPRRPNGDVFAWAHGTVGQGDGCAPSRRVDGRTVPYLGKHLAERRVVVATDYEGLGPPGPATYLVGRSEAHAVLDSVRAAAALPDVPRVRRVVLAGHSQGGHAVLFAAEEARQYARRMPLAGTVAIAAPVELASFAEALRPPALGFALVFVDGLRAAYPGFDPASVLTRRAVADLERVAGECLSDTILRWSIASRDDVLRDDISAILPLLDEQSPGAKQPRGPVLLVHGDADELVPVRLASALADDYCARRSQVTLRTYGGASHSGVLADAATDVMRWIDERFAGRAASSGCGRQRGSQ